MCYLARKLLILILSLTVIASCVFFLSRLLPQNIEEIDEEHTGNLHQREVVLKMYRQRLGLDKPLFYFSVSADSSSNSALPNLFPTITLHGAENQFHAYFSQLITFNFGRSLRDQQPVIDILKEAVSVTISYTLVSFLLVWAGGIVAGIYLVGSKGSLIKKLVFPTLYALDAFPLFLLSLILLAVFAGSGSFVASGWEPNDETGFLADVVNNAQKLILPVMAIFLSGLPYATIQTYTAVSEVIASDFILTAKAKGLGNWTVICKHAFRNALIPLISLISESLPVIITGAVVVEIIFGIPGMGKLLVNAVLARDYPVIMAVVLLTSFIKIASIMFADIGYRIADPRVKI